MSRYTIQLNKLIKSGFDLGLDDYPIYDENHRKPLNDKIINHYYYNEIGLETPALFKHFLNSKMREIMPYYNELFESAALEFDPLNNFDKTEVTTRGKMTQATSQNAETSHAETAGNSTGKTETDGNGRNVYSDTPQGLLSESLIEGQTYATNATIDENHDETSATNQYIDSSDGTRTQSANQSINDNETINKHIFGKDGTQSYSELLKQYRETLVNIDMMIIDELSPLFMGVF